MKKKFFSVEERARLIGQFQEDVLDVLVIGGGINGAVSIAACAHANLKCGLIEKHDFASMTSQSSSNLIWGGIKYLENYEFPLVYKLCACRNRLMRNFPSTVKEMRFFTLHEIGFRYPLWFLFAGTLIYELIGKFKTKLPRFISGRKLLKEAPHINPDIFDGGFEYSDAVLPENDARFVLGFILKAYDAGATILNYCGLKSAKFENGVWICTVENADGTTFTVKAKALINTAGPYVDTLNKLIGVHTEYCHRFSKGIHLVFPKLDGHDRVITSFADDGRLFFSIPMENRTCVGTTDIVVKTPEVTVTDDERHFLLSNINRILKLPKELTKDDIIAERCGVRPLVVKKAADSQQNGDWFKLSRKHEITVDETQNVLSVFGGKLTDCLNVGEEIQDLLKNTLGFKINPVNLDILSEPDQTAKYKFFAFCRQFKIDAAGNSSEPLSERLWRRYHDRADVLIEMLKKEPKLLKPIGNGVNIYRIDEEMAYRYEMAITRDDFLRRRTLGSMVCTKKELSACTFTHV